MSGHEFHSWLSVLTPITVALVYYGYWRMVRRLRQTFPSVWKELGEPGFFKRNSGSIEEQQSFSSFLKSRRYRQLGDSILTFYGNFTLIFLIAFVCLAIVSFASLCVAAPRP